MARRRARWKRAARQHAEAVMQQRQLMQENVRMCFENEQSWREHKRDLLRQYEELNSRCVLLTNLNFLKGASAIQAALEAMGYCPLVEVRVLPARPGQRQQQRVPAARNSMSSGRAVVEFADAAVARRLLDAARMYHGGQVPAPAIAHRRRDQIQAMMGVWRFRGSPAQAYSKASGGSYTFAAQQLQVGSLVDGGNFVSEWSASSRMKVQLDLSRRCLSLRLQCGHHTYRLDIRFKFIRSKHLRLCSNNRLMFTLRLPPRVFQKKPRDAAAASSRQLGGVDMRWRSAAWAAEDGTGANGGGDGVGGLLHGLLGGNMFQGLFGGLSLQDGGGDDGEEQKEEWWRCGDFTGCGVLGRCLTFMITLQLGARQGFDDRLVKKLHHFGLLPRRITPENVHREAERHIQVWQVSDWERSNHPLAFVQQKLLALPFQLAWHIQVLLDDGVVTWHNLTPSFFGAVADALLSDSPAAVCRALKLMSSGSSNNRSGRFFTRPGLELSKLVVGLSELEGDDDYDVPAYCVRVLRVLVTPLRLRVMLPENELSNRVTRDFRQQYGFSSSDFLRLCFGEETGDKLQHGGSDADLEPWWKRMHSIAEQGVGMLGKQYDFLAYGSSQLKDQSMWMVHTCGMSITPAAMRERMGDFMSILIPAKCAARMGQCFSSTFQTVKLHRHEYTEIPDVTGGMDTAFKPYVFSDGVGTISPELLRQSLLRTPLVTDQTVDSVSAIQVRFQGCKGVLSLDPALPGRLLCYRPSMAKFTSSHVSLEICSVAKPIPCYLNRHVILLLTHLGVSRESLCDRQQAMIRDMDDMTRHAAVARVLLPKLGGIQGRCRTMLLQQLQCGLAPAWEPFLRSCLEAIRAHQLQQLRAKARLRVEEAVVAMGVMDEQGLLQYGQIFVQNVDPLTGREEPLEGMVVVAKHPVMHQGDVRRLQAVDLGAAYRRRYRAGTVAFPRQGHRPHPNELSGSDLDGDLYAIMWAPDLMPTHQHPPMDYTAPPPKPLPPGTSVGVPHLLDHFVNHAKNDNLGRVANAWLAHADRSGAGCRECLQLAELHAVAVDFPKTGVPATMPLELNPLEWPHWMEKKHKETYKSNTVLGAMFEQVMRHEVIQRMQDKERRWGPMIRLGPPADYYDPTLQLLGCEPYLEDAVDLRDMYEHGLLELMNRYAVHDEAQVLTGCIWKYSKWHKRKEHDIREQLHRDAEHLCTRMRQAFFEELLVSADEAETQADTHAVGAGQQQQEEGDAEAAVLQGPQSRAQALRKASACYMAVYHPDHAATAATSSRDHQTPASASATTATNATTASTAAAVSLHLYSFPWIFADLLRVIRSGEAQAWVTNLSECDKYRRQYLAASATSRNLGGT